MSEKLPLDPGFGAEMSPEISDSIASSLQEIFNLKIQENQVKSKNSELYINDGKWLTFTIKLKLPIPEGREGDDKIFEKPHGGIKAINFINDPANNHYEIISSVHHSVNGPIPIGFDLLRIDDASNKISHVLKVESKRGEDVVTMLDETNPAEIAFQLLDRVEMMRRVARNQE